MLKNIYKRSLGAGIAMLLLFGCGSNSKPDSNERLSGESSLALSIVYESTSYDEGSGKMIGHYHVHIIDDKGDPVSHAPLTYSLVNGVKIINGQKLQYKTGTILDTKPIMFQDSKVNFAQAGVVPGDLLIVVPKEGRVNKTYLGDWKIDGVGKDLKLRDKAYGLQKTDGLTYIIGTEERLLGNREFAVAHIQKQSNTTDDKGFSGFDIVFDPVLAGHTATVGVHTTEGPRAGGAKVITFRGGRFFASDVRVPVTGDTRFVFMRLMIDPGNGGTEDLIDIEVDPTSFQVQPASNCAINYQASNFHTDSGGHLLIAVDTFFGKDANATDAASKECVVKWSGDAGSLYYEY